MFERIGKFIARHWLAVIVGWLVLAAALCLDRARWQDVAHDGDLAYLPELMPSVQGERLLARAFPDTKEKSQLAVVLEPHGGPARTR